MLQKFLHYARLFFRDVFPKLLSTLRKIIWKFRQDKWSYQNESYRRNSSTFLSLSHSARNANHAAPILSWRRDVSGQWNALQDTRDHFANSPDVKLRRSRPDILVCMAGRLAVATWKKTVVTPGLLRDSNGSLLTNQSLDSWSRGQELKTKFIHYRSGN